MDWQKKKNTPTKWVVSDCDRFLLSTKFCYKAATLTTLAALLHLLTAKSVNCLHINAKKKQQQKVTQYANKERKKRGVGVEGGERKKGGETANTHSCVQPCTNLQLTLITEMRWPETHLVTAATPHDSDINQRDEMMRDLPCHYCHCP